jgi:hypothetical protein
MSHRAAFFRALSDLARDGDPEALQALGRLANLARAMGEATMEIPWLGAGTEIPYLGAGMEIPYLGTNTEIPHCDPLQGQDGKTRARDLAADYRGRLLLGQALPGWEWGDD